jgi:SNF2 family DNA or RNA helicase
MAKLGQYNLNCALCDDMGLGKTIQSLVVVINESKKVGKKVTNLVVCPTSLTYNWLSEIQNFFTEVKAAVIDGIDRLAILDQASDYDILIINYEKVGKCLSQL